MAGKRDEVTIAEVAEALNISKTTVSRAISGKGRVSEATRARVLDYIGKGRHVPHTAHALAQERQVQPHKMLGRCVEHGGPARI